MEKMSMENVKAVVSKVVALRRLSIETGTITRRAQGKLLQALSDAELAMAAELLAAEESGATYA
jgi:hypothetical protein